MSGNVEEYFLRLEAEIAMLKTICTHLLVKAYENDRDGLLECLDSFESFHLKAGKVRPRGFDPRIDRESGKAFREFCAPIREGL